MYQYQYGIIVICEHCFLYTPYPFPQNKSLAEARLLLSVSLRFKESIRLVNAGTLKRILQGIYEKPKYSKLLDEYVAADPNAIAKALARCYHWTIAPCGNTALNLLGLSTQVTAVWSYISDGPYKAYEWNSTKLEFKHRTNKEIKGSFTIFSYSGFGSVV